MRSELYSEGKKRAQLEENERNVRQLKRSGREIPSELEATIASQKSKLMTSKAASCDSERKDPYSQNKDSPRGFFGGEANAYQISGGEFVYSTDFREPLVFETAFAPAAARNEDSGEADNRGSLILPTTLFESDIPGGDLDGLGTGYTADGEANISAKQIDFKSEDSFQSIPLDVAGDPGASAAIVAAGMSSRPTTAPTIEDGAYGESGTAKLTAVQREELERQRDHQEN